MTWISFGGRRCAFPPYACYAFPPACSMPFNSTEDATPARATQQPGSLDAAQRNPGTSQRPRITLHSIRATHAGERGA
jgi:hypothetical protein